MSEIWGRTGAGWRDDARLAAYIDGELAPADVERVEADLADDPALRQRLEELRIPERELARGLNSLLAQAPSARPGSYAAPQPKRQRRALANAAVATGLLFALGLGGVGGFWLSQPKPGEWTDYVAAYQALYVPATLKAVPSQPDRLLLAQLGEELGIPLEPAIRSQKLIFKRAQMLGFEGKPLVQLAYSNRDGTPVALCITSLDMAVSHAPLMDEKEGMAAVTWIKNGLGFLLIGAADPKELMDEALHMEAVL